MMNTIMYELLEARLMADSGTHLSASAPAGFPLILIPSKGITVSDGEQIYRVGGKQLIILHPGGEEWSLMPEEGKRFGDVHCWKRPKVWVHCWNRSS